MDRPSLIAPRVRGLTAGEAALLREVFSERLAADRVRVMRAPWPVFRAFAPGRWFGRDWIVYPQRDHEADFARASLYRQSVFVHELVHLWQARQGVNLLRAKLKAGFSDRAYRYVADDQCAWEGLNIEQQAMVAQHRFLLSRGASVPGNAAFYARVCPLMRD